MKKIVKIEGSNNTMESDVNNGSMKDEFIKGGSISNSDFISVSDNSDYKIGFVGALIRTRGISYIVWSLLFIIGIGLGIYFMTCDSTYEQCHKT